MPMTTRSCEWCQGEFQSNRPWQRFCCEAHQKASVNKVTNDARTEASHRICAWCQAPFESNHPKQRFCSVEHQKESDLQHHKEARAAADNTVKCLWCQVRFTRKLKDHSPPYCSPEHHDLHKNVQREDAFMAIKIIGFMEKYCPKALREIKTRVLAGQE